MQKTSLSKKWTWILGGVLLCGAIAAGVCWPLCSERAVKKSMEDYAFRTNIACPISLGSGLTLNRVTVMPERTLSYLMSFDLSLQDLLQSADADFDRFKNSAREKAVHQIRTDPSMKVARQMNIKFNYLYRDAGGQPVMEYLITPKDYQ